MAWSVERDFDVFFSDTCPNYGSYTLNDSSIKRIYIMRNSVGTNTLSIQFVSSELTDQFKEKLRINNIAFDRFVYRDQAYFNEPTAEILNNVIDQLSEMEPRAAEIKELIFTKFQLEKPVARLTLQDLLKLPYAVAIENALELQKNNQPELSYELFAWYWGRAQLLEHKEQQIPLEEIYKFGTKISEDSPYFFKAQQLCLAIMIQRTTNSTTALEEQKSESLDGDNEITYRELLKLQFKHAFVADPNFAKLLLRQLCGVPMTVSVPQRLDDYILGIADEMHAARQFNSSSKANKSSFFESTSPTGDHTKEHPPEFEKNKRKKLDTQNNIGFRKPGT